jgi:predicted DNA-binding protein YlxM (UPF0122 family)
MFEKNMRMAYLLDFYEALLDEHTAEIMKLYYNDDLSLAEIASGAGISRQGIRHLVKKGEDQLSFFDERLGLAQRHSELGDAAEALRRVIDTLSKCEGHESEAKELSRIVAIITKGN